MSVASPPVSVEKFRNRIDASSRATVFEVVQGNDKLLDTLRLPDTDDMRFLRNARSPSPPALLQQAARQERIPRPNPIVTSRVLLLAALLARLSHAWNS